MRYDHLEERWSFHKTSSQRDRCAGPEVPWPWWRPVGPSLLWLKTLQLQVPVTENDCLLLSEMFGTRNQLQKQSHFLHVVLFKRANIVDTDTKHTRVTHTTCEVDREQKRDIHLNAEVLCVESKPVKTGQPHLQVLKSTVAANWAQNVISRIWSGPGSAFVSHPHVNLCDTITTAERNFPWQHLIGLPFGKTLPCLGTSAWQCLLSGGNCYPGLPNTVYTLRAILRHARPPLALLAYTQDFIMFTLYIQESA